jgi:hypothetical protein
MMPCAPRLETALELNDDSRKAVRSFPMSWKRFAFDALRLSRSLTLFCVCDKTPCDRHIFLALRLKGAVMRRFLFAVLALAVLSSILVAAPAVRTVAAVNTYQVTGPVMDVSNDKITVQKGKEKWELARDSNTKVTGTIAKGKTVTIRYRMIANDITVK